jgi:hypothetical protein
MTPIVFWLALAWGVDAGYEPAADGHLEYIIQVEPQLVESLATGHDLASEVPRGLDIRHYRLTIDTGALPHNAIRQASQRTAAPGGGSGREADQFEEPGISDEAVGATTPQVHVGYQELSASGGEFIIEIDPSSLGDLNEHDLTGDLPPDLRVTRFVVSTRPGSAPSKLPVSDWGNTAEPVMAAMPAVADNSPTVAETGSPPVDQDASTWHAEDLPPTGRTAAVQNGPTTAAPPTSMPLASIPDDNPGGDETPPPAMPPFRQPRSAVAPQTSSEPVGNQQPGGNFQTGRSSASGGTGTHDNTTATGQPVMVDVPGRFPASTTGAPMAESRNVFDNPPAETRSTRIRKQREPEPSDDDTVDSRKKPAAGSHETGESQPAKPWLPLTLTLLGLFASLGGNVFLGWVAWDSYNRSRANAAQFDDDKAALSR